MFRVQLLKGLLHPHDTFDQLERAEAAKGLWPRVALLFGLSIIIALLSGFFGINTETVSKQLSITNGNLFEWQKALFAFGNGLSGVAISFLVLFVVPLFYWSLLEVDFLKLLIMQLFVFTIYLIENILLILLGVLYGIDRSASPFGLGVAAQYIMDHQLALRFFGSISIFQLWAIYLQYQFLKRASDRKPSYIMLMIIGVSIILWVFGALFSSIRIEQLF